MQIITYMDGLGYASEDDISKTLYFPSVLPWIMNILQIHSLNWSPGEDKLVFDKTPQTIMVHMQRAGITFDCVIIFLRMK